MGSCVSRPRSGKKSKSGQDLTPKGEKKSMYLLAKPSEFSEVERLNMQHYMLKVAFGDMHISEVNFLSKGGDVLDVCSGSGIWCFDMAKKFPKANINGIDITPLIPSETMPHNAKFFTGNASERLPFPDNSFDFVHFRLVLYVFKQTEWIPVLKEVHRVLKKGGYVQLCESAADIGHVGECGIFTQKLQNVMAARGQDPKLVENMPSYLQAANFKQLKSDFRSIPMGWGNRIGEAMLEDFVQACVGARSNFSKVFGFTPEQYDAHLERVVETSVKEQQFVNFWNFWGVKEDDVVDDNPTATKYDGPVDITTLGGEGITTNYEWMESVRNDEFNDMVTNHAGKNGSGDLNQVEEESKHGEEQEKHGEGVENNEEHDEGVKSNE